NFKELYNEFSVKLDLVEEKTGYFEERNEYLNNLIGREVGASLFETFKQRKTELDNPLEFWRWSVLIMGALTFAVVLSIFTNFFGYFPITSEFLSWGNIVVNFLKSSPFFFL